MKVSLAILVIVLLLVAGGFAFLSVWTIPPPVEQVEKVIPDDRLSR